MNDLNAQIKPPGSARWDCISLGEVMLRLDPGEDRIHTVRNFRVWEGGGEYNVARGLRRCFGLHTAIATALADNAVGRLVEDLMLQGGVDQELVRWVPFRWSWPRGSQWLEFYRTRLRRPRRTGML